MASHETRFFCTMLVRPYHCGCSCLDRYGGCMPHGSNCMKFNVTETRPWLLQRPFVAQKAHLHECDFPRGACFQGNLDSDIVKGKASWKQRTIGRVNMLYSKTPAVPGLLMHTEYGQLSWGGVGSRESIRESPHASDPTDISLFRILSTWRLIVCPFFPMNSAVQHQTCASLFLLVKALCVSCIDKSCWI